MGRQLMTLGEVRNLLAGLREPVLCRDPRIDEQLCAVTTATERTGGRRVHRYTVIVEIQASQGRRRGADGAAA